MNCNTTHYRANSSSVPGDPTPRDRDDRKEYESRLQELIAEEKRDPQLANSEKRRLAEEFVNRKAGHLKTQDGYAADWTALAQEEIGRKVAERRAMHNAVYSGVSAPLTAPEFVEEEARQHIAAGYSTPEALIGSKGWNDEYETVLEHAAAEERAKRSPLSLNGMGYYKSMEALQQQFPYYIASVDWRQRDTHGQDHGYIKPRFNRPEDALAGYYDTSITGRGKVTADRTRHQNRLVARPVADKPKADEKAAETTESARTAPAGADDDLKAMFMLRNELRGRSMVRSDGKPIPIAQARESLENNLRWIYGLDDDMFLQEARRDPAAAKKGLLGDVQTFVERGFGNVDQSAIDRIKDPAKADKGRALDFLALAGRGGKDHNFDLGAEVESGRKPNQYEETATKHLRKIAPKDATDLDSYIDEQLELRDYALHNRGKLRASHAPRFEENIRHALIVKQARRRAVEAQNQMEKEAELAAREKERMLLDRDVVVQVDDPSTARSILPGSDPKTLRYTKREDEE